MADSQYFWPVPGALIENASRGIVRKGVFFAIAKEWFGSQPLVPLFAPQEGIARVDLTTKSRFTVWPTMVIDTEEIEPGEGRKKGIKIQHRLQAISIASIPEQLRDPKGTKVSAGQFLGYARSDGWPYEPLYRGVLWTMLQDGSRVDPWEWATSRQAEFHDRSEGARGDTLERLLVCVGGSWILYDGRFIDGKQHPFLGAAFLAASGYLLFKGQTLTGEQVDELDASSEGEVKTKLTQAEYQERFGPWLGWDVDELPYSETQPLLSRQEFLRIEKETGIPAPWIAVMTQNESGALPDNHNRGDKGQIVAAGIFQYTTGRVKEYGLTASDVAKMDTKQQADLFIKDYTKQRSGGSLAEKLLHPADLYLAHAAPGAIGRSDDTVFYRKDGTEKEQAGYEGMPGFDVNKDGKITVAEMRQKLIPKMRDGLKHVKKARK